MKKPINRFALALWVVALALVFADAFETWSIYENLKSVSHEARESYLVIQSIVRTIGGFLFEIAMVFGIGALIEVADHIRWDLKNRR
jgi:hypothetical protein